MKILVVSQYFYPDNFRVNMIAEELVKMGNTVYVLTGLPDYTTGRIPREYRGGKRRSENLHGVHIKRVPTIARRTGVFFRALNYLSFVVAACTHALCDVQADYDLIYVFQTSPVLQAIPALLYRRRRKIKVLLYCCDVWPESLKAWDVKEKSILYLITHKLSRWIYRSCDLVAVSSEPFEGYLETVCGVSPRKIQYLPQFSEDICADTHGQYTENGCIDFLFAGNVGKVQNLDCLLEAVAMVPGDLAFQIHIVGDGSELENLKRQATALQIESRVTFHGRHPLAEMQEFYNRADCFLLMLRGKDFIGMTLPGKTQSYFSAGKPVVGALDGAGYDLVTGVGCGAVVHADDVQGLARAMTDVIARHDVYRQRGVRAREYYEEHFTSQVFMDKLINLIYLIQLGTGEKV